MKTFLTSVLALLLFTASNAQVFFIEAHASARNPWILQQHHYGMSELSYETTYGLGYGMSMGYDWNKHWGFRLGFDWAEMGQNYSDGIGLPDVFGNSDVRFVEREVEFVYLYIPALMRFRQGAGPLQFVLEFGPQFGFQQDAQMRYTVDDVFVSIQEIPGEIFGQPLAASDYFKQMEVGGLVGAGLEWRLNRTFYFHGSGQVYVAATDLNSDLTRTVGEYTSSRNAAISLQAGFGVRLGYSASREWQRLAF